jgi:hypothetical protein
MLYRYNVLVSLCIFSFVITLDAAYKVSNAQVPKIQSVEGIPAYCTFLVKQLDKAPFFEGHTQEKDCISCSYLCLDNWDDCRICDIVSKNAQEVRKDVWKVRDFGCGKRTRYSNGKWAGMGIEMYKDGPRCSLDELLETYMKVAAGLKAGWKESSVDDYRKMLYGEPKKDWRLFIKTRQLIEEICLIKSLASKFGIDHFIECGDLLLKSNDGGCVFTDIIYLLIAPDKIDEVQKVLGFPTIN